MTGTKIINKLRSYRLRIKAALYSAYMYQYCRVYGVSLGKACRFWNRSVIIMQNGAAIRIGDRCLFRSDFNSNLIGVGHPCIISAHAPDTKITIGRNVQVGANSLITDFDWHAMDPSDRNNPAKVGRKPVVLENNVWIGSSCIILKGVTIGENTVVGSGSVVTTSLPANSVCCGNPCKVIRQIEINSNQN